MLSRVAASSVLSTVPSDIPLEEIRESAPQSSSAFSIRETMYFPLKILFQRVNNLLSFLLLAPPDVLL